MRACGGRAYAAGRGRTGAMDVEGRRSLLSALDNVVIPPSVAHYVQNSSASREAVFHIAMPTESPTSELVDKFFSRRPTTDDSTGPGGTGTERVNRFRT